jgi:hypothetical protein
MQAQSSTTESEKKNPLLSMFDPPKEQGASSLMSMFEPPDERTIVQSYVVESDKMAPFLSGSDPPKEQGASLLISMFEPPQTLATAPVCPSIYSPESPPGVKSINAAKGVSKPTLISMFEQPEIVPTSPSDQVSHTAVAPPQSDQGKGMIWPPHSSRTPTKARSEGRGVRFDKSPRKYHAKKNTPKFERMGSSGNFDFNTPFLDQVKQYYASGTFSGDLASGIVSFTIICVFYISFATSAWSGAFTSR